MVVSLTGVAVVGMLATVLMVIGTLALVVMAMNEDRHQPGGTTPDGSAPETGDPDGKAA